MPAMPPQVSMTPREIKGRRLQGDFSNNRRLCL